MNKKQLHRLIFGIISLLLLIIEIIIGIYASGWIRNYLGDVIVVILIYTIIRFIITKKTDKWYLIPTAVLMFSFAVEFLQLWGFCDRFGITNKLLRIIIGTGFSIGDLISYSIGVIPCYIIEFGLRDKKKSN